MKTNFIKNTTNKHYSFRYSIDGKEKKIDFPPFQTVRVIDFAEVKETESYKTLTKTGKLVQLSHLVEIDDTNFKEYTKNLTFKVESDKVDIRFEAPELAGEQVILYVNYNGTVLDPQFIDIDENGVYEGILARTEQSLMYEVLIYNKFLSSEPDTFLEVIDYPIAFTPVYRIYI